jgi:hypothetical protein
MTYSGPYYSKWYGFGRINALAAVQAAINFNHDMANPNVDIIVRDNIGDDGSVPSSGWHAVSPDIWVSPTDPSIPLMLSYNSEPPHQDPEHGHTNYVFCRVKNRGNIASAEVYIRAVIAAYPGFEFGYPLDFIARNHEARPTTNIEVRGTEVRGAYLIGERKIETIPPGEHRIVMIPWPENLIRPDTYSIR